MAVTINNYQKKQTIINGDKDIYTKTFILEKFKTVINLNPNFMKEIFYISPHGIFVQSRKTIKYGDESLNSLGPHLWNSPSEKN